MITALLMALVLGLVSTFMPLVTVGASILPDAVIEVLGTLLDYSMLLDQIFPVTTLYLIMSVTLSIEFAVAVYKISFYAYEQVRHIIRS